ncbi:glycerophosphodiester phosphodiesterase family protein [uncultured Kiloniella sp.]|uniref:glycerophosphodiester phosphodiesterase family protein n=1 Tax=uncultured Kiloniella sp. TaxID=1133091 RepID=UPI002630C3F2|nr:glycerophosphodiester phosphodiesterase family protein [uncultured Kiloniella sp.]
MANATPLVKLPRVQAHRGAKGVRPENTMASLREALDQGVRWTEFDVKLSKDGVPIIYHDQDLKRTSGIDALVKNHSFAELREFEAGAWFDEKHRGEKIPSLEEFLLFHIEHNLHPNIELKPSDGEEEETARKVVELLDKLWPKNRNKPLFSSFKLKSLEVVRDLAPDHPRGLLLYDDITGWQENAKRLECSAIHLWHKMYTSELVKEIKQAGYATATYTVNEVDRGVELVAMGVDSIITDFPGDMIAAIGD